jgi:hypothetical protein
MTSVRMEIRLKAEPRRLPVMRRWWSRPGTSSSR